MFDLSEKLRDTFLDGRLHSLALVRRSDGYFEASVRFDHENAFRFTVHKDPARALGEILELRSWWPLFAALRENLQARETVSRGT